MKDTKNLHEIPMITLNDKILKPAYYCYDLVEVLVSLAVSHGHEGKLSIDYSFFKDYDLAVSAFYRTNMFSNRKVH